MFRRTRRISNASRARSWYFQVGYLLARLAHLRLGTTYHAFCNATNVGRLDPQPPGLPVRAGAIERRLVLPDDCPLATGPRADRQWPGPRSRQCVAGGADADPHALGWSAP